MTFASIPVVQFPMSPIHVVPRQTRCQVLDVWLHRTTATSAVLSIQALAGGRRLAHPIAVDGVVYMTLDLNHWCRNTTVIKF